MSKYEYHYTRYFLRLHDENHHKKFRQINYLLIYYIFEVQY